MQREGGQQGLWLRNIPTNSNTQIAPPSDELYGNLEFSPDGNFIYFLGVENHENGVFTLFRVPVLGGSRESVIHDINSRISYSPDRSRIVFTRYKRDQREFDLVIANAEGSGEKIVSKQIAASTSAAWSPDGKWIIWAKFKPGLSAGSVLDLVDPATGKEKTLIKSNVIMALPRWLPDQSGILVLVMDTDLPASLRRYQIGMVSYPQGVLKMITNDTNYYVSISLSADGRAIATVQSKRVGTLQTEAYDAKNAGQPITIASRPSAANVIWTSDGNLLVEQDDVIYKMDATGGNRVPLTPNDSYAFEPTSCGKDVVFSSERREGDGFAHVWRMDPSGGNLKELPTGTNGDPIACSPDGKWLVYVTLDSGKLVTKKVSVDGGPSILLPDVPPDTCCAVSPDGKDLAFGVRLTPGGPNVIKILDFETLQLKRTIAGLPKATERVEYAPDGKSFGYLIYDQASYALWVQPLDGTPGRRVTEFSTDPISRFAWSHDGKTLALIRSHNDSDVVLLRETSPSHQ
jgi:Tol biopolymer transport system component